MKKVLCTLLAALLLAGCAALAEAAGDEPSEVAIQEVQVNEVQVNEEPADEPGGEVPPQASAAPAAPAPDSVRIGFEDGFALDLPEGWLVYPTDEDMAAQGVVYCLSDAEGEGWLYVQIWQTDCADMTELKELIDRTTDIQTSGVYNFNGTDFVVYDLTEGDVSCCAALMDGQLLNLVFTPQSDADFMAVAAQILSTFELL